MEVEYDFEWTRFARPGGIKEVRVLHRAWGGDLPLERPMTVKVIDVSDLLEERDIDPKTVEKYKLTDEGELSVLVSEPARVGR